MSTRTATLDDVGDLLDAAFAEMHLIQASGSYDAAQIPGLMIDAAFVAGALRRTPHAHVFEDCAERAALRRVARFLKAESLSYCSAAEDPERFAEAAAAADRCDRVLATITRRDV